MRARPEATILRGYSDHERFCRESLRIRDKSGRTVPFLLQPAQKKLHEAIERARRMGRPVRIVVLKARQVMISAGTAAEFFHEVPFNAGQRALIVAHEVRASKNIFSYYSQLDASYTPQGIGEFGGLALPPHTKEARAAGVIGYENGSSIEVSTANNVKTGRSASIRFLHLSEFAFWRDAKTLMAGLMQSVPDDADTIVVIESTANGVGGEFYDRCMEAMNDPSSEWIFVFFAWHEHPEYTRPVADPPAFQRSLSREELQLQETYHLTLGQLHWRRWAIKAKCNGSVDTFKQEYPSCPLEAFLFSGRPRLSHEHLSRMPLILEGATGELEEFASATKKTLRFLPNEGGAMTLYKRPQAGKEYVIGTDVCEGLDPALMAGGDPDPDYTVHNVFDRDTGEQVAKVRARLEPDPAADYLDALGRFYNWAFLVPEANAPGIALIEGLLRRGYPPSLIYHRRPNPDEQFADDAATKLQFLGWKTSTVTRVQLISKLDAAIRDFSVLLHDPNTIREHQTFVIKANGRAEHQDGCHDDEVISTGLGVVGIECPPPDRRLLALRQMAPNAPAANGTVTRYGQSRQAGQRGTPVRL